MIREESARTISGGTSGQASGVLPLPYVMSNLARLARPRQWVKNLVVAAAVVFAGRLDQAGPVTTTIWAVLIFCAVSSSGYILNDAVDAPADRRHPTKRFRPIAAGAVGTAPALGMAALLLVVALAGALAVRPQLALVTAGYALLTASYTLVLKRIPALDVLAVAGGFVLRAFAGAVAIDVPASGWLLLLTSLAALYIILTKRLTEPSPAVLRGLRSAYPAAWLRRSVLAVGLACLGAYAAYVAVASNLPNDHVMLASIPFVGLGLYRYASLSGAVGSRSGPWLTAAPDEALVRDLPLLLIVAGWAITCVAAMYWVR